MPAPAVPSLVELALDEAVRSFAAAPFRAEARLTPAVAAAFHARLPPPTDDTVATLAAHVDNDAYWRRAAHPRGGGRGAGAHGGSHKRAFFETTFRPGDPAAAAAGGALPSFADQLHALRLQGPRDAAPFDAICRQLPNLAHVELRHASSLNLRESIPQTLSASPLITLALTESRLGDDDVAPIVAAAAAAGTLLHLDLGHNRLSCAGARALAEGLVAPPVATLAYLDLAGNRVCAAGAAALGAALENNAALQSLSLRLNAIGDEGAAALVAGLAGGAGLRRLHLGACGLRDAAALAQALGAGAGALETIVLTANAFSVEDVARLRGCATEALFVDARVDVDAG